MAIPLRNETQLEFTNISSEEYREYINSKGQAWYRVSRPQWLAVSESGGHRILDAEGVCHYVQPHSCFAVRWEVLDGEPHFVK